MGFLAFNYYDGSSDVPSITSGLNIGSNSGRVALVHAFIGPTASVSALAYAGEDLTPALDSDTAYQGGLQRSYAKAITATGSNSLTATMNPAGAGKTILCALFDGIASIRSVTHGDTGGTASSLSVSATTVAGDIMVVLGFDIAIYDTFSATSPATRMTGAELYFIGAYYVTPTTGTTTITGTFAGGNRNHEWTAFVLEPTGGGGSFTLTADQGSFALTGQTSGLLFNRSLTADQGAYALTGQDGTLTKATPGAFVLTADAGQYIWTGEDALADYAMNGEQGSYALSGQDVTFTRGFPQAYTLTADAGSYTFNGQNVRLDWSGAPVVPNRQAGIYMGMRIGL